MKTVMLVMALALQVVPNVATLKPFSHETNFLSRPGYARWVSFQQTKTWISYAEAKRMIGK